MFDGCGPLFRRRPNSAISANMLKKRGFKDWAGDVDGYGDSLEIRVFAVRLEDRPALPKKTHRHAAKRHLPPVSLKTNPLERDERIRALLHFAEKFHD